MPQKSQEKAKEAQLTTSTGTSLKVGARSMSRSIRRAMIDRDHQQLSLVRSCGRQPGLSVLPAGTDQGLELMALMDRVFEDPLLRLQEDVVSRKRVRRLMRLMGLEAIYRRPNTRNQRRDTGSFPIC